MAVTTDVLTNVTDSINVRRVFGDPIDKDGVTLVPVAAVMGGGGGGEGGEGAQQGAGTGFGVRARPVGAYAIRGGEITWQPAFDLMRVITASMIFATLSALMAALFMRRRGTTYVFEDTESDT